MPQRQGGPEGDVCIQGGHGIVGHHADAAWQMLEAIRGEGFHHVGGAK